MKYMKKLRRARNKEKKALAKYDKLKDKRIKLEIKLKEEYYTDREEREEALEYIKSQGLDEEPKPIKTRSFNESDEVN